MNTNINVIITGATGMVGEGALHMALQHPQVNAVLVIGRRSCEVKHPKLKEIILPELSDVSAIENQLSGYNACLFCLGTGSVGVSKEVYYQITYVLTINMAKTLSRLDPDMTFSYISGAGTDSSEKGRLHWSRVKGKTENDLMRLPFRQVLAFRPGFIKPISGLHHTNRFYKYILWLYPIGKAVYPSGFCTLQELGNAMINTVNLDLGKRIITGKDIIKFGAS